MSKPNPRVTVTDEPDILRVMRRLIAPWELPRIYDQETRKEAIHALSLQIRGQYQGGKGAKVEKKGLAQIIRTTYEPKFSESIRLWTWAEVLAQVDLMTPEAMEGLREANRVYGQAQRDYPRFAASNEAAGCGPWAGKSDEERTPAQRLYAQEYEAFQERLDTYMEEVFRPAGDLRDAAHDACYDSIVQPMDYLLTLFDDTDLDSVSIG